MRKGGVVLEDWPFVILFGLLCFGVGFLVNMVLRSRLPYPLIGLFGGVGVAVAFFNWTRRGKRHGFLQHLIADYMQGCELRGWLPDDIKTGRADYIIPARPRGK